MSNRTSQSSSETKRSVAQPWTLTKPVFFVGFMGAGKSTVARRLARKVRIPSIDLDTYIERSEGMSTAELFAEFGEDGFRDIEHRVLTQIAQMETCFVSCGGGIVKRKENRNLLKQLGFVIYLKVDVDEAVSRISRPEGRPLLNSLDDARALNEQRIPLYYEVADVTLNTAGKTSGHVVSLVQRILKRRGILCREQE